MPGFRPGSPFACYVYLHGREWLARQMDQAGMRYLRHDNCFRWIEDFARAQSWMDQQLNTDWSSALEGGSARVFTLFAERFANYPMSDYWTAFQSEWAMDIVFRDPDQLRRLYPQLIHLGMVSFSSPDRMRCMDQKVSRKGDAVGPNAPEIVSALKVRSQACASSTGWERTPSNLTTRPTRNWVRCCARN